MTPHPFVRRAPLGLVLAATVLIAASASPVSQQEAAASAMTSTPRTLPLGEPGLTEVGTVRSLAPGVRLTQIVRGGRPATPATIDTTSRGPWRVNVLTLDPQRARGHLEATYGKDLAQTDLTTSLVKAAGALAGVNSSYFTFTRNRRYPGDPVGLGLYGGVVLSEPAAVRTEVDLLVDARTNQVKIGRLTWYGSLRNRATGTSLRLDSLNSPPAVPTSCRKLTDPTTCTKAGEVVHIRRQFGRTPSGPGVEVVLNRSGCVVRVSNHRGTVLTRGRSAVQATGRDTRRLLALSAGGCLSRKVTLYDERHHKVAMHANLYGVAGRYRLTRSGRIVVPAGTGYFFARHARTFVGTTASGKVLLVTIDGGRTTSVGATLAETAAVAQALGLRNSLNLDGGGSTTMVVRDKLLNRPSGAQRAVGDALVYVNRADLR